MKGWIKYLLFVLVIIGMIIWLGGFLSGKEKPGEVRGERPIVEGLTIGTVEKVSQIETSYSGQIVADKRVEISTRLMGKVTGVYVKEGQAVKKGQLLLSIDAEDIRAQALAVEGQIGQAEQALKAAMANLEAVKKTYERYSALLKEGAITQQEFDQIKAQYEAAKAQVEQAKAGIRAAQSQREAILSNIKYTSITSPISGYVVYKNIDVGDTAIPGHPLLVIESPPYLLEVFLPEKYINKVSLGKEFKVLVQENLLVGKVKEISPALDPLTKTFRVKLELSNYEDIKSGMYAHLLTPEEVEAILVPQSAIVRRFDFTGVWVVKPDNTLELRFVKLGEVRGDKVEILSGLKEGEKIVIQGIERACEGCRVGG